jgi:uncharacterized protein
MKLLLNSLLLIFTCASVHAQNPPEGTWEGAIRIAGTELNIAVTFNKPENTPAATIDIPQQSAMGLPLINVQLLPPRVHLELQAGPGVAVFEGKRSGDSITGVFTQSGMAGTFFLRRRADEQSSLPKKGAETYEQEEVKFNNDTVTLAGTLTLPRSKGKHPAVVMITGSGPQNRDEEILGFKPFKLIAEALTGRGIAVLRYDDRGVGGSSRGPADATTEDFATDALCAVRYLQARSDINTAQIGLCGHSEGALAAAIAAVRSNDVAFIVLLAGPGVAGDTLILWQLTTLARAGGAADSEIAEAVELQHRVYDAVRTGKGWEEVRSSMGEQMGRSIGKMPAEQRKALGDSAKIIASRVETTIQGAKSAWFRYFISYDPAPTLQKVQCAVLALYGELDKQVPPQLTMPPLKEALQRGGNMDATVSVIPGANHLFQAATTGHPSEYGSLKKEFVPGFLDTMADWIAKRVTVR